MTNLKDLATEKTGSVASTNAKAALFLRLTIWTGIITATGWIYCVTVGNRDSLANDILWGWLAFLAAFGGINAFQRKVDRQTDYGYVERQAGAAPTVVKETTRTVSTELASRETVAPVAVAGSPTIHDPGA